MGNIQPQDTSRILPGDVVQIVDETSPFRGCLAVIEAVPPWGLQVFIPQPGGEVHIPLRLKADQVALVGAAVIIAPAIQNARAALQKTRDEVGFEDLARSLSGHPVVMQLAGLPDGSPTGLEGQYLEAFDFEAFDGTGNITLTTDIGKAKQFACLADALAFRDIRPQCRQWREDGQPNRPLTSTTWAVVPAATGVKH